MNQQRFVSLDLFRGFTVALMFLVNLPGSFEHVFSPLDHAEWHGLTLADFVFPWFLVAVGAAVPLAMDARRAKGLGTGALVGQLLWRSALLFLIGVLLGWILRPRFTLDEIRIAGVLQRIAIVYCLSALAYLWLGAKPLLLAGLSACCLALAWFLLTQMTVPAYGAPNLDPGTNYFAWLDQQFLPGRLFKKTWDPEGLGGTLPAIGSALSGMALLCALRKRPTDTHAILMIASGAALVFIAIFWSQQLPFNKNLWTPSFVLITSGMGFVVWGLLVALEDRGRSRWLSQPNIILTLGQAALTAYIVHWMLLWLLIIKIGDHWIGTYLFNALSPAFPDPRLASLVIGAAYVSLSIAPMPWLTRKGWLIRV
jgi:predicted acyltransferase